MFKVTRKRVMLTIILITLLLCARLIYSPLFSLPGKNPKIYSLVDSFFTAAQNNDVNSMGSLWISKDGDADSDNNNIIRNAPYIQNIDFYEVTRVAYNVLALGRFADVFVTIHYPSSNNRVELLMTIVYVHDEWKIYRTTAYNKHWD